MLEVCHKPCTGSTAGSGEMSFLCLYSQPASPMSLLGPSLLGWRQGWLGATRIVAVTDVV